VRIFLQSTVFLPTPAPGAGGVELLVATLARELHARGHEVTLFGLAGSDVGEDIATVTIPPDGDPEKCEAHLADMMFRLHLDRPRDVLFDHSLHCLAQRRLDLPVVSMCHGMAPIPPWARNVVFTTQHHGHLHGREDAVALYPGLDLSGLPDLAETPPRDFLLWAGRIIPYKRPELAIDVAQMAKLPLKLVGPVVDADLDRRLNAMWGRLPTDSVRIAELPRLDLLWLMGQAKAVLFTSDDTEPAGLILLEAQAIGVPVVAFAHGSALELSGPGAWSASGVKEMADIVRHGLVYNPAASRRWVEEHFTIETMGAAAERLLRDAVKGDKW
jgi:glycosyltransferase involved in cell wall biosynthesis